MPDVRGCHLPDDLLYDVENHIWFKELDDGNVKLGMTTVATAMAGQLVAFTPKKVGRDVQAGKSCATVESGKWVGPAKSAAAGEIVAVNDDRGRQAIAGQRRSVRRGLARHHQARRLGRGQSRRWCPARRWPVRTRRRWLPMASPAARARPALQS